MVREKKKNRKEERKRKEKEYKREYGVAHASALRAVVRTYLAPRDAAGVACPAVAPAPRRFERVLVRVRDELV